MPDGAQPVPGGWNRFVITVDDIEATVGRLRDLGTGFRNEIITGPGEVKPSGMRGRNTLYAATPCPSPSRGSRVGGRSPSSTARKFVPASADEAPQVTNAFTPTAPSAPRALQDPFVACSV